MEKLTESFAHFSDQHCRNRQVWIACSGGLDSLVLLHLAASVSPALSLQAIYVDHGCHPEAGQWRMHCQKTAASLGVPFLCESLPLNKTPDTDPENALRKLRYAAFLKHLGKNDILLTGHHRADQAETVLLQMLRGAGPKGLAAMSVIKSFGEGRHGRPLLGFSKKTLQAYAVSVGLTWVEDPSNIDRRFMRNYLRHDVMPLIQRRWPQMDEVLSRVAENCADLQACLNDFLQEEMKQCAGSERGTLSVRKLQALSDIRRRGVVRHWIAASGFILPPRKKLLQLLQDAVFARMDRMPHVTWQGADVRRYRDDLHIMRSLLPHDPAQRIDWDGHSPLLIKNIGVLSVTAPAGGGYTVCFRRGGEVCQLPGRSVHHSLKKIFQAQGVLPWCRDRIPLVFMGSQLVAAAGVFSLSPHCVSFQPSGVIY